jgi:hypothetical protein
MKPLSFTCTGIIPLLPEEIAANILAVERWPEFEGYGILPGITEARFDFYTPAVVGSRIAVQNSDGSSHVEEITRWEPQSHVQLTFYGFSPPLCYVAGRFVENWVFSRQEDGTLVTRSMDLYATRWYTRPFLFLIAPLLRRAVAHHLTQLGNHR